MVSPQDVPRHEKTHLKFGPFECHENLRIQNSKRIDGIRSMILYELQESGIDPNLFNSKSAARVKSTFLPLRRT